MDFRACRIAILCLAAALSACAPAPRPEEPVSLVWPAAPDPARIAFVRTISRSEDLGISKRFFQRVYDLLFGEEEARIVRPMAIVEADGILYVADPGAKGVHRFDPKGGDYDLIHATGGKALPSPVGLALGASGEVYVTDSALGQVFVIRPGAEEAAPVSLGAALHQPTGIACDPASGRLYVVDTAAHDIKVFNRDGTLVSNIGHRGVQDGEFNFPTLLWRTREGLLYVTDSLNYRIQILDREGRFVAKFGRHGDGSGDQQIQKGVAIDSYGHVYVVDSLIGAFQIFDDAGKFLLLVGGHGRERGEFWLPTGIFITETDTIYVADSHNQRVQVFRYIGGAT